MPIEIIRSDKAILRTIARTYVYNKKDVINLVNKYIEIPKDINRIELFEILIYLFRTNTEFSKDFTKLAIEKNEIQSTDNFRNASGILGSVVGLVSNIFGNSKAKKEAAAATQERTAKNIQSMMAFVMEEEKRKTSESKGKNNIIALSLGGVFLIIGIAIYLKNR